MPLISIVALCYNHENFLEECLDSIIAQSYPNIELIIIDDFSTDNSVAKIEGWITKNDVIPKWIKHNENLGLTKSLNEALDIISGEYFQAISCDDILILDKISIQVSAFKSIDDTCAVIYGDMITINQDSEIISDSVFKSRGWFDPKMIPSGNIYNELAKECIIPAPSVLIRSDVARMYRYDQSLYAEDWDFWLRVSRDYKIIGIPEKVVKYRIHENSMYQKKDPRYIDSLLQTNYKQIGNDKAIDKIFKQYIYQESILNYMRGGKNNFKWLLKRYTYKPNLKNMLYVCLALFGISYKMKERFKSILFPKK